jgi:hypothetical protein
LSTVKQTNKPRKAAPTHMQDVHYPLDIELFFMKEDYIHRQKYTDEQTIWQGTIYRRSNIERVGHPYTLLFSVHLLALPSKTNG